MITVHNPAICWHDPGIRGCYILPQMHTPTTSRYFAIDLRTRSLPCCLNLLIMGGSDEYPQKNASSRSLNSLPPKLMEYDFLIYNEQNDVLYRLVRPKICLYPYKDIDSRYLQLSIASLQTFSVYCVHFHPLLASF
jgi:hypothetical protein